jgi:hypothetical protein
MTDQEAMLTTIQHKEAAKKIGSAEGFYASSMPVRQAYFDDDLEFSEMRNKLLAVAPGSVVVRYDGEKDVCLLNEHGREMTGTVEIFDGELSQCHSNVADLLSAHDQQGISGTQLCTGYCYSEHDHMWRQHSWAMLADGTLLETCGKRDRYWGFFWLVWTALCSVCQMVLPTKHTKPHRSAANLC